MRLASVILAGSLLGACGQIASRDSSKSSAVQQTAGSPGSAADGAASVSTSGGPTDPASGSPLRQGLYDVSTLETIAGVGDSPERHSQECVTADMAAHPEFFLNGVSLPGCNGTAPTRNGTQVTSELQCADNHTISINTSLSHDGWEQTVSGQSENGTYESHETASRVGDC